MTAPARGRTIARFGSFELNLGTGELRNGGVRVRLQQQPFIVLAALLERSGELVTREELQRRLWPDGRFVDYEDGLATAVKKVRRALRDSSASPRFVETLPKRGYRFVGQVAWAEPPDRDEPADAESKPSRRFGAIPAVAAVVLAGIGLWAGLREAPRSSEMLSEPVALTRDSGVTADPAVSADGRWLAYASDRDGGDDLDIWIQPLPLGSAEPIQLTDRVGHELRPDFSPDGGEVVYESLSTSTPEIFAVSTADRVERFVGPGRTPRYSPDGRWILLAGGVLPAAGGDRIDLGNDGSFNGGTTWLPDGRRFLAVAKPDTDLSPALLVKSINGDPAQRVPLDLLEKELGYPPHLQFIRYAAGGVVAVVEETSEIWHLRLSEDARSLTEVRLLVRSPPAIVQHPNLVDGKLVYGVRSANMDLVSLPVDAKTGTVSGPVRKLTDDPGFSGGGSVSTDGLETAYSGETDSGAQRAWFKDLGSGEAYVVDDELTPAGSVLISPQGDRIAFAAIRGGPKTRFESAAGSRQSTTLYLDELGAGRTRLVCAGCGNAAAWSSDGTKLLTTRSWRGGPHLSMSMVDVDSGQESVLFDDRRSPMPSFIWGDTHVLFAQGTKTFAARLLGDRLAPERDWITVADAGAAQTRWPAMPPDGDFAYFVSNRDSYWCVWARRIDRGTRRPEGEMFPVYHSHRFRSGLAQGWGSALRAGPDGLIFNWFEDGGNIWMVEDIGLD